MQLRLRLCNPRSTYCIVAKCYTCRQINISQLKIARELSDLSAALYSFCVNTSVKPLTYQPAHIYTQTQTQTHTLSFLVDVCRNLKRCTRKRDCKKVKKKRNAVLDETQFSNCTSVIYRNYFVKIEIGL